MSNALYSLCICFCIENFLTEINKTMEDSEELNRKINEMERNFPELKGKVEGLLETQKTLVMTYGIFKELLPDILEKHSYFTARKDLLKSFLRSALVTLMMTHQVENGNIALAFLKTAIATKCPFDNVAKLLSESNLDKFVDEEIDGV